MGNHSKPLSDHDLSWEDLIAGEPAETIQPVDQPATDLAYIYRREGSENGRNEIEIPLARIMARKAPDVPLLPNDVLYVPDNKGRRMTMTMVDRLVTFGAGTASGMLVWRR